MYERVSVLFNRTGGWVRDGGILFCDPWLFVHFLPIRSLPPPWIFLHVTTSRSVLVDLFVAMGMSQAQCVGRRVLFY